jgi:hypothetical protein
MRAKKRFLEEKLPDIVSKLYELGVKHAAGPASKSQMPITALNGDKPAADVAMPPTTKTIATKLSAASGTDVARAAIAHLGIIKAMATFSRADILTEMRGATGFYRKSMSNNLTKSLSSLIADQTINENGSDVYALTPVAEKKLRQDLGAI